MSIDYVANYGVGYQVEAGEGIPEEELDGGLTEYLYVNLGGDFFYFEVGEGIYTGKADQVFIVVREPFSDGLDLTGKKEKLDICISRLRLKIVSDFGVVGGLHVY